MSYVFYKSVLALLKHRLCLEKVALGASAGVVVVGVQTKILFALSDAVLRDFNLLVSLVQRVPLVLDVDDFSFSVAKK